MTKDRGLRTFPTSQNLQYIVLLLSPIRECAVRKTRRWLTSMSLMRLTRSRYCRKMALRSDSGGAATSVAGPPPMAFFSPSNRPSMRTSAHVSQESGLLFCGHRSGACLFVEVMRYGEMV